MWCSNIWRYHVPITGPYVGDRRTTPVPSDDEPEEAPEAESKRKRNSKPVAEKVVSTVVEILDEDDDVGLNPEPVQSVKMMKKGKIRIANKKRAATRSAKREAALLAEREEAAIADCTEKAHIVREIGADDLKKSYAQLKLEKGIGLSGNPRKKPRT
jgi:hypothetical protein